MQFSSFQVLLLAVVAITSTPRSAVGQAAPEKCAKADVGKQFCSNCNYPSKCVTENLAPVLQTGCKAGQACKILLDKYAVCKPVAETPCTCGVKNVKCDPYDPHSVFVCLSGGITTVEKCNLASPTGTCIDGKCGTAPPQATTVSLDDICLEAETGFIAVTPECTTAAYCQNKTNLGTSDPCGVGQYFDADDLECLPAPPLPCPVACGSGACYDKGNCSKWYICDAGTVLAEETCEGTTPEFNTVSSGCVLAGNGTCSKNNGCNFGLITTPTTSVTTQPPSSSSTTSSSSTKTSSTPSTTSSSTKSTTPSSTTSTKTSTTPSTPSSTTSSSSSTTSTSSTTNRPSTCGAANVGIRYPVEGNCKKYTACRLVSTNVYGYVESSCLGLLVFNAKTGYCDTLANVPGCVPPA